MITIVTEALQNNILSFITDYGDVGVFIAMFLESSIIPIPSEVIIAGAGAIGVPINSIVIFGSLGSTLGGIVGYSLGRYGALPIILKFGKYFFITPERIHQAENLARKYGSFGVLLGRILPVVPFKVFSIAAGIAKIPLVPFIIFTLIGVVPRLIILSLFGAAIMKYTKPTLLALAAALVLFLIYKVLQKYSLKPKKA